MSVAPRVLIVEDQYFVAVDCELQLRSVGIECVGLATTAADPGSPAMRRDVIAGLVASAVVLPKAMAYASVAGLPVAVGLYTAFVPMVIYALLGSSRVLSVSSTTTLGILAGTQLGLAVPDGDPAKLVTMARRTLVGTFIVPSDVN